MKVRYQIKQVKSTRDCDYSFMNWDYAKNKYNANDYEVVYEDEIEMIDIDVHEYLEQLFTKFNINRPKDFKGHSLSTSDVIHLGSTDYYCDSFGWIALK